MKFKEDLVFLLVCGNNKLNLEIITHENNQKGKIMKNYFFVEVFGSSGISFVEVGIIAEVIISGIVVICLSKKFEVIVSFFSQIKVSVLVIEFGGHSI